MNLHTSLKDFESDVLKEIGNIGAGHAATSLATLLNKPINMKIPAVNVLKFQDITKSVGNEEDLVVATYFRIEGDISGHIFFIVNEKDAGNMLEHLVGINNHVRGVYTELEQSAFAEIGNILTGSYLSSLSDFMKLSMAHSVPSLVIDMAAAVLDYVYVQFSEVGDHALLIDTKFIDGDHDINSHFFLIPDPDSFEKIFKSLGVNG